MAWLSRAASPGRGDTILDGLALLLTQKVLALFVDQLDCESGDLILKVDYIDGAVLPALGGGMVHSNSFFF